MSTMGLGERLARRLRIWKQNCPIKHKRLIFYKHSSQHSKMSSTLYIATLTS